MSIGSRFRAYAELARVSNTPTVVSNALAGAALGALSHGDLALLRDWKSIVSAAVACTSFYIAGMAINDLADRRIDARERPHRPIPSGRVSQEGAGAFASVLVIGGLWLLSLGSIERLVSGIGLVFLIILYNAIHARTRLSVLVMGACRAMVIVTAALSFGPLPQLWPVVGCAVLLFLYVMAFSLIARREAALFTAHSSHCCGVCSYPVANVAGHCPECGASLDPARRGSIVDVAASGERARLTATYPLLFIVVGVAIVVPPKAAESIPRDSASIIALVLMLAIIGFLVAWLTAAQRQLERVPQRIGAAVTMWIAAISLFDAFVAILCGSLAFSLLALSCFFLTRAAQRGIAGT